MILEPPSSGKVLLHSCCAPCSGAILECMLQNGIEPTVFFSNSNIVPFEEYELRKAELARYCDSLGVPWVDDAYDHQAWLYRVAAGRESMPERGPRCLECFKFRLLSAALYASQHGFGVLTTSLASSRWKSLEQVDAAGQWVCGQVDGVQWWAQNWRKGGLQPRRCEIIKEQNFYNQNWCGCEFSRPEDTTSQQ